MRSRFTDQEIADYRGNGFLAIDDLLSRSELGRWREVVETAMAGPSRQPPTATGANMTPGRRRAMSVAFMPDGVRFNGRRDLKALDEAYLDTLSTGDLLANDELNPVVYSR